MCVLLVRLCQAADVQIKEALMTMMKENASSFDGDDDCECGAQMEGDGWPELFSLNPVLPPPSLPLSPPLSPSLPLPPSLPPFPTADLKHNVTEAMISMARQTGKIGPDVSG